MGIQRQELATVSSILMHKLLPEQWMLSSSLILVQGLCNVGMGWNDERTEQ